MNENLGMVMVFTLVSAAQEWLNVQWDRTKMHREESAALKLKEEEEAERVIMTTVIYSSNFVLWNEEYFYLIKCWGNFFFFFFQKRFEGTRVTVETFLTWKEKFDEEMGITKRREIAEREGKKLTGRELFMTDKTLDQSDLKFLEDGGFYIFILSFDSIFFSLYEKLELSVIN